MRSSTFFAALATLLVGSAGVLAWPWCDEMGGEMNPMDGFCYVNGVANCAPGHDLTTDPVNKLRFCCPQGLVFRNHKCVEPEPEMVLVDGKLVAKKVKRKKSPCGCGGGGDDDEEAAAAITASTGHEEL
ncbi:hypothetical protein GQ42DRAFT_154055 [Ramicandelaber brevisporus]|nr:hypothetical protein GQ42DRAFT_154055 [Ramicandelaber brevisporus]